MFRHIKGLHTQDNDLPERAWHLKVRHAVLDGTLYDVLPHEFNQERDEQQAYIPMRDRAPSVRHGLCRTVVRDSVALLFSEGRFPKVKLEHSNEEQQESLDKLIKQARLQVVMIEAATFGSTGSVVVHARVLRSRLFFTPMRTTYLTPTFDPEAPDSLLSVRERYKVKGTALRAQGYSIPDTELQSYFWFEREWTATEETWFLPRKVLSSEEASKDPQRDASRSVIHDLGFCPMVWIKNLPGGDDIDGISTFDPLGIENQIEMDYQMSAGGRGLKYTSSPTLVIKTDDPQMKNKEHAMGDALLLPEGSDAHNLEISGHAVASVVAYCDAVRKLTLEALGGSRVDPDRISAAQSGRAMEILNQSLINLADQLRGSYGEDGLVKLIDMARRINVRVPLEDKDGDKIGKIDEHANLVLKWPAWYPATYADQAQQATALTTLKDGGVISGHTATQAVASTYDIEDVEAERGEVDREGAEKTERETEQQRQVASFKAPPGKQAA